MAELEAFLGALADVPLKAGFRFSIVNAFEAINARLIFLEDNEVICTNHYVCLVSLDPDKEGNRDLVLSPGGEAVFEAILHAVFTR